MAFSYTGTATVSSGNIGIFPDGTSTSVTFDVTKQPFNLPFAAGNCPSSVVGTTSYSLAANPPGSQAYKYNITYSYDPLTFEVTITFTKDLGSLYASEPDAMPTILNPGVNISFLYTSL